MVSKTVKALAAVAGVGVAGVAGFLAWQRYGFGDMELSTVPAGVTVSVDGITMSSPFKARLTVGMHTLTVPRTIMIGGQTLNLLWDDGTTNPTRTVVIVSTDPGVVFGNLFLATYSAGTGGQILGSVGASPSVLQNTQYFSAGAVVTAITGHPFLACQWSVAAFSKWTQSNFSTELADRVIIAPDANGTVELSPSQTLPVLITAYDTTGKPMAGVAVDIWTDPQILSPLDNRPLFKILSVDTTEPGSGIVTDPYKRTTDANGQAVITLTPASYVNNARLLLCSDQVVNNNLPEQTDEAPGLCPNVGDGSGIGSGCSNCSPQIGCSKTGFCCTRNNVAISQPVQGISQTSIHVRALGTLKEVVVILSMTAQIRL